MTNRNPFDEHIKRQLENLSPEVPPGSWDKILQAQSNERRRGFFYFLRGNRWLLAGLVVLLFTSGALIYYKTQQPDNSVSQNSGVKNITGSSANTYSETISQTAAARKFDAPETSVDSRAEAKSKQPLADQPEDKREASESTVTDRKTTETIESSRNESSPKTWRGTPSSSSDASALTAEKSISFFKSVGKRQNTKANTRINIKSPDVTEDVSEDNDGTIYNGQASAALSKSYLHLATEEHVATPPTTVTGITLQQLSIPCPGSGKPLGSRNYVEVYGSPDYVFRSFSDTASSAYLKQRKETTKFTSAFSFGIRYTRLFKSGFSFRTGVNFSQINERFKYESGQMLQNVFIVNEQGDTTGSYTATTSRYKVTQNRYRTIDVPLLVGYETRGERFRVNINAGPVINIYSWQKGDILGRDNQPVNITTGKSNSIYSFKTNAGIGVTGGASLYYKWKGNLYFLAEPWFRYNFSAANKADITLKQKFTTAGLRLGVRMDF